MPKRGLEPPHLTIYAPKAYVSTITPLGQMENTRVELVTDACKAPVLPLN